MITLIDTSIWIDIFKDKTDNKKRIIEEITQNLDIVLSRFTQLELLQGAKNEHEWKLLHQYLEFQTYLESTPSIWTNAARIYFDCRRQGKTVRSPIDCCIAQLAIDNEALLLHRDQDFINIAEQRNIQQQFIHW